MRSCSLRSRHTSTVTLSLVTLLSCVGFAGALAGCGSRAPSARAVPSASTTLPPLTANDPRAVTQPTPVAGGAGTFPEEPVRTLTPIDRGSHDQAVAAFRAGHLVQAKRLLGRLAAAYPDESILLDQYNAVSARITARQDAAQRALQSAQLRTLPAPPFAYTLVRPSGAPAVPVPKLVQRSKKANGITDDEQWFASNGLRLPEYFVPPSSDYLFAPGVLSATMVGRTLDGFRYTELEASGRFSAEPLPPTVPLAYGTLSLKRVIESSPYLIAIYDANVVAVFERESKLLGLFDFVNYLHPPASKASSHVVGQATLTTAQGTTQGNLTVAVQSIVLPLTYATARDGVLYVTHSNLGYAKESAGQNAYVSAIDLGTGELAWRSAPLVANIRNIAIVGGGVVCGYGFTAEPDFVYVLDRATGVVRQKITVKSGPDYVVPKGDQLFIRTYDTDYVFDVR